MDLQRGQRDKLDKYVNLSNIIDIEMNINGSDTYDFCCFGVDANDKLSDDRYMIFYNQITSPNNEISYSSSENSANFRINLASLPMSINKLVFTVSIDGNSIMRNINSHTFLLNQNGVNALKLQLSGNEFMQEKAIISVEIYRKDVWRINAVARGFNGGLVDLLRAYGGEEVSMSPPPPSPPQSVASPLPVPTPAPAPQPTVPPMPAKINLQKGQKVSLVKGNSGLGEILINLNWSQPKGFFAKPIDLDLGCLFELKDGSKGTVQALGNKFGSLNQPPYIALDGDDRSGSSADGENLRINGKMVSQIKRILVYTFIYDGVANWKGADGVVTVKCPGSPEIVVRMDEYNNNFGLCAIALLENVNDTLSVQKIVNFYKDQSYADAAFGWGLKWKPGKKD